MRARFLTVPINERGIEEYDHGIENTENMIEIMLPEKEYVELKESGIFEFINEKCDLLIDDYESEIIDADDLRKCITQIELHKGIFLDHAYQAMKYKTFLALDF